MRNYLNSGNWNKGWINLPKSEAITKDYLNYKVLTGNVKYSASAIYNTNKYDLDFS